MVSISVSRVDIENTYWILPSFTCVNGESVYFHEVTYWILWTPYETQTFLGWPSRGAVSGVGSPADCLQGRATIFWKWYIGGEYISVVALHSIWNPGHWSDDWFIVQFLTRTKWWAVPLIWLPIVCWCLSTSIKMGNTITDVAMMIGFGIFLWTLIEYVLHRFLFHIKTKSYW